MSWVKIIFEMWIGHSIWYLKGSVLINDIWECGFQLGKGGGRASNCFYSSCSKI